MSKRRDAREFARLLASDPVFQSKVKKRVMDELDGKFGNQIPATQMILELATEDAVAPSSEFRVTFVARIIGQPNELTQPQPLEVKMLPEAEPVEP